MFADDLSAWKAGLSKITIEKDLQLFLDQIFVRNSRCRMKVNQKKTVYNSYSKKKKFQELNLIYNGKKLSRDSIPKFLGVHLDSRLNFAMHLRKIKEKCN